MSKRRFEFKDTSSDKFWEIDVDGNCHTVCFGRTGTNGQLKVKEFDSPVLAMNDAAKLIQAKVNKGYQETILTKQNAPIQSERVTSLSDLTKSELPTETLFNYLKPLLTQSTACEDILRRLTETARNIEVFDDGSMQFGFVSQESDDEEDLCTVTFAAPFNGKVNNTVAKSLTAFCRVHNGVRWTGYLDSGFNGLNEDGSIASGGWEYDALTEAGKKNAVFIKKLKQANLDVADVPGPFDYGQNWLITHPAEKNALGEDALYFVSHGDCVANRVIKAHDLAWGPIVLRVLVEKMLGDAGFSELYD